MGSLPNLPQVKQDNMRQASLYTVPGATSHNEESKTAQAEAGPSPLNKGEQRVLFIILDAIESNRPDIIAKLVSSGLLNRSKLKVMQAKIVGHGRFKDIRRANIVEAVLRQNETRTLQMLLQTGLISPNETDLFGHRILELAARQLKTGAVALLLKEGAVPTSKSRFELWTSHLAHSTDCPTTLHIKNLLGFN